MKAVPAGDAVLATFLQSHPALLVCGPEIRAAFLSLVATFNSGNKLLVCGNGGSAADSEHIVGELMKRFLLPRAVDAEFRQAMLALYGGAAEYILSRLEGALPAISLTGSPSLATAIANDVAADLVFAQQVYGLGKSGDCLLALSTSGNSMNVVSAVRVAKAKGLATIGMTGASGGLLASLCDTCIRVPSGSTPEIQEYHLPVYHALCAALEASFFAS